MIDDRIGVRSSKTWRSGVRITNRTLAQTIRVDSTLIQRTRPVRVEYAWSGDGWGKAGQRIEIYLDLLAQNRLNVDGLITHRYPLEHYAEAFLAARKKRGAPGDQGDLRSHGEHT